ncbi:transcription factor HES-2-like [Ornithodoros turicata]|uniref:transcription factor HES-2-like n=1 Tax=Ornithodoros turicata TaxID=34597 RepID=UPI0031387FEB
MKPLMEKRRRARINHCLSELKRFLVANDYSFLEKHNNNRTQRVEKADILEMTVKYLRDHRASEDTKDKQECSERFQEGYRQCMIEICRYTANTMDRTVRDTLVSHLKKSLSSSPVHQRELERTGSPSEPTGNSVCVQPRLPSGTSLDFGYETGSPTDISDDSSSDCGEPRSPPPNVPRGHYNVPEDYSLPKMQRGVHVSTPDGMWRPW